MRAHRSSFDEEWGTETEKIVWLTKPSSKNFIHGIRYEACSPEACRWAIESAGIDYQDFYFVDMGCGKGRPLVIASQYPFRRLVGVEYSARLCRRASLNLAAVSVPEEKVEIVCRDAVDFCFAEHDSFVYLHNPFGPEILETVLRRLQQLAQIRRVIVAYEGPRREQLAAVPWLRQIAAGNNISLFASTGEVNFAIAA